MKIGIITMHKVLNYGSALQAYALQQKLFLLGYNNELIDYAFPSVSKNKLTIRFIIRSIIIFLRNALGGFPTARKKKKFNNFYRTHFRMSERHYDEQSIKQDPPYYDAYLTGSDQVWNPRFAGTDSNFFLDFAPSDKPKFSYASSFATTKINIDKESFYRNNLSRYDEISVRETTGVKIVKELTGKDAFQCCDPTFLLSANEWASLSNESKIRINKKYILVYILGYMIGNVYDEVQDQIDYVQQTLGYMVVYLVGRKEDAFRPNSKLYKSCGPSEFVWLFANAEFVVTTSFHGVVFSLIHEKPLLGIVNMQNEEDSRIQSLLESVGANQSCWDYRKKIDLNSEQLLSLKGDRTKLDDTIAKSVEYINYICKKI